MDRRLLTAAFLAAALMPQALAAQTATSSSSGAPSATSSSNTANHNHSHGNNPQHPGGQSPWWRRGLYITGVNAQNYLLPSYATPVWQQPPSKNKINKPGGTIFKSIGN